MPTPIEREAVLRLTSAIEDLARLYPWLEAASGEGAVPPALLPGMHVVLEETVANVALHAYAPGETGEITVRLQTTLDAAVLVVEDAGVEFDWMNAPPKQRATSLDDATPGGLGLHLIRHYCADITQQRRGGRNRLVLRFPVKARTRQSVG